MYMYISLILGHSSLGSGPWILLEDLSLVFSDVEVERASSKHSHKKRKLADGREKTMVSVLLDISLSSSSLRVSTGREWTLDYLTQADTVDLNWSMKFKKSGIHYLIQTDYVNERKWNSERDEMIKARWLAFMFFFLLLSWPSLSSKAKEKCFSTRCFSCNQSINQSILWCCHSFLLMNHRNTPWQTEWMNIWSN